MPRNNRVKYDHYDEDYDSEAEVLERIKHLEENYTLEDFLDFPKTREVLEQHFIWNFEKDCDDRLDSFYESEVEFCQSDFSTLFINEREFDHKGDFRGIIFKHIKPKYDLDLVYYDDALCKSFEDFHEENKKIKEEERLRKVRENYSKTNNAGKSFDWGTKTYK